MLNKVLSVVDDVAGQLDNRLSIKMAYAIIAIFSVLILISLINFGRCFWLTNQSNALPNPIIQQLPDMAAWHLFGLYTPSELDLNSLPETTLPLNLSGTFVANAQRMAAAAIVIAGNEQLFTAGSEIMPGVILYKVLSDCVILKHNGNLEILRMPQDTLIFSPAPVGLALPSS